MSLTADLRDRLQFFEKLLENKHMNETTNDTNMTGNADNRSVLRTNCGQGINHDVQVDVAIPFRSRDEAIIALCQKVFGAWPVYVSDCDQPATAPSDVFAQIGEEERSYALAQYHLACSRLSIGSSSSDPGDTLLEAVCRLQRELAQAKEANDGLKLRLAKVREKLSRELAEAQGNAAALKDFENYCRVSIRRTLDDVGAPFLHPDIGAPARKPMMPTERIKALAEQRDALAEAADEARKQRDTLAEALEKIVTLAKSMPDSSLEIEIAKQALAAVKGGEA